MEVKSHIGLWMCIDVSRNYQIGLGGVWFDYFLLLFSLKIKNGDGNEFGWIFENIFSENIFSNEPKTGNNKISFSVEIKNLILGKMKTR